MLQTSLGLGAWLFIDGVDLVTESCLSYLTEMISSLREAISGGRDAVQLATLNVPIKHLSREPDACAFAMLVAEPIKPPVGVPAPARRRPLADFLKQHTRRVAVRPPAVGVILEAALRCAPSATQCGMQVPGKRPPVSLWLTQCPLTHTSIDLSSCFAACEDCDRHRAVPQRRQRRLSICAAFCLQLLMVTVETRPLRTRCRICDSKNLHTCPAAPWLRAIRPCARSSHSCRQSGWIPQQVCCATHSRTWARSCTRGKLISPQACQGEVQRRFTHT